MSQARRTRRGTRTRTRRRRYSALDHLMLGGIVGMGVYLILRWVLIVPVPVAAAVGVLGTGYYLGSALGGVSVRSPIVVRRRGR